MTALLQRTPLKIIRCKVITDVPAYTILVGDECLNFDSEGQTTMALPIDSDRVVYYDPHQTHIGQKSESQMSECQTPGRHTVETDSRFGNGFAGLDVLR